LLKTLAGNFRGEADVVGVPASTLKQQRAEDIA
jgi:hypothetical protein